MTLGEGAFGTVYRALCTETEQEVAVKCERENPQDPGRPERESEILKLLGSERSQGFAAHYHFAQEGPCNVIVMELLGKGLDEMLERSHRIFQVKTTVLIAQQMLQRLEYLHSKGVVHQDMKPDNCALGVGPRQHHLYMIDFGLSSRYYEERHVSLLEYEGFVGSARYASINAHRQLEQSRRDDLESLGHMLLQFVRGFLPWTGLSLRKGVSKLELVGQVKRQTSLEELCAGLPREFKKYMRYCRGLRFQERPDYAMLRGLFADLRGRLGALEGRPLEDHDLEWNAGQDLGPLEPLDLAASYRQPDDGDDDSCNDTCGDEEDPGHRRRRRDGFPRWLMGGRQPWRKCAITKCQRSATV
jgi:serine/threonine protein kinase